MANFCRRCGSRLDEGSLFCGSCGARVVTNVPPVNNRQAPRAPRAATPQANAPQANTKSSVKKKKKAGAVVAAVLSAAVLFSFLFTAFVAPGFLRRTGNGGGEIPAPSGRTAKKETVAIPEDLLVKTDMGVSVDFALLDLEGETELTVEKKDTVTDDELGASYTAYDFSLGGLHDLGGYFEIRLPYSGRNIEAGQDPAGCVAGMYFNEDTSEWESVLYRVDTAGKQVVILTNHFSTYGCFEFQNEGKRMAKVSEAFISSIDQYSREDVKAAIEELKANRGVPGQACRNLMLPTLERTFRSYAEFNLKRGEVTTIVTNIATLAVAGTPGLESAIAGSEIATAFNDSLGNCGRGIALCSLITMYRKADKTDQEIIGMYKDTVYFMGSLTGDAALGTIGAAVWCVDYALNQLGNYAYNKVSDDTKKAFMHYMTTPNSYGGTSFKPRTLEQWRSILYKLARKAEKNGQSGENLIMHEIDRYCGQFWELPSGVIAEVYDHVGQAGRGNPDAATKRAITNDFKGSLIAYLTSALLKVQEDIDLDMELRQLDMLDGVREVLNRVATVEITELVPDGKSPVYAGYTVAFAPLNSAAVESNWRGPLNKDGRITTRMTYIGWLLAGSPDRIELYAPGKKVGENAPEKTVSFTLDFPRTTIVIDSDDAGLPASEVEGTYNLIGMEYATGELTLNGGKEKEAHLAVAVTALSETSLRLHFFSDKGYMDYDVDYYPETGATSHFMLESYFDTVLTFYVEDGVIFARIDAVYSSERGSLTIEATGQRSA